MTQAPAETQGEALTARQQAVLDAVLSLMVEKGSGLTMTAVARRASCSKETLYKWFGDRDGLLTATVQWQASKVRAGNFDRQTLDAGALRESLKRFAANWLEVISSPTSIALNRIGVSQAAARDGNLGSIVLANGRFAIGKRMMPVLEAGGYGIHVPHPLTWSYEHVAPPLGDPRFHEITDLAALPDLVRGLAG